MFQKKIKIQELKDRITAIECLQESGQDDDAEMLLKKLGEDIINATTNNP